MSIARVPVGQLFTIRKGRKPSVVFSEPRADAVRLLQINDLRGEGTPLYTMSAGGTMVESRDVVIAWDGANAGTVGFQLEGAAGSTLAVLRPVSDRVYSPFAGRFLQSRFTVLNQSTDGAAVPHINRRLLESLGVPLPPLVEQRRIAAILDTAYAIRRKRQESLRLLDEFLHSAFREMFGDPVRNEKGWARAQAASAIHLIEAGTTVKGAEKLQSGTAWAVLKISAVTSGWYLPEECKGVAAPPDRPINPRRGDLLFSRANTRELVAATCLVDQDADRVFLPDKLWRITPNSAVATAEYLRFLFADSHFRRALTQHATGTSGSMLNVSQEKVLRIQLPLPPLELQDEFAKLVWKTFRVRDNAREVITQSDRMVDVVAHEAFG